MIRCYKPKAQYLKIEINFLLIKNKKKVQVQVVMILFMKGKAKFLKGKSLEKLVIQVANNQIKALENLLIYPQKIQ